MPSSQKFFEPTASSMPSPEHLFPFFFPFFFVAFWCFILTLISRLGGWNRLAEKYSYDSNFLGTWKGWLWGRIGMANYKRCLWVGVSPEGLHLKTGPFFFFQIAHPPLRIPWYAITTIENRTYWFMDVVDITLSDPKVKITLERGALDGAQRFLPSHLHLEQK